MEPVYAETPSITGSKLENYKELKKKLCDTNIFETFSSKNDLVKLLKKYQNNQYRTDKLNQQKDALEKIAGSYDSVLRALNEI